MSETPHHFYALCEPLLLLPEHLSRPSFGGSISVAARTSQGFPGLAELPMPKGAHRLAGASSGKASLSLAGHAAVAVIEVTRRGGFNPYLVFSWFMDRTETADAHAALLDKEDRVLARWLSASAPMTASWFEQDSKCRGLRASMNARVMGSLFDLYGPAGEGQDGHWLACRLLPRRRPGCVILTSPLHLQLWIDLTAP